MAIKKITSSTPGLIAWVCAAHVASMLCYAIYPTLLPQLQQEWGASNSAAGLISCMFFAGYMASVPVLSGLTDRVDARRVYFFSILLAAALAAALGWRWAFALCALGPLAAGLMILAGLPPRRRPASSRGTIVHPMASA